MNMDYGDVIMHLLSQFHSVPCVVLYLMAYLFSRIVFPHRKKNKQQDEIVYKKFILATEVFEFGPLLVGKSRDRYDKRHFEVVLLRNKNKNKSSVD